MDPSIIDTETTANGGRSLVPCRNIFREMKKQKYLTEITMYFHKLTLNVPASLVSPSTSSTSASATPETAKPTPLLPPTQPKDKDEDL